MDKIDREKAERGYRTGETRIMVTTDTFEGNNYSQYHAVRLSAGT